MADDARQVVERHVEAWNARQEDAFPWSAGIEMVAPGADLHGREAMLGFLRVFWQGFPDARVDIGHMVSDGSAVAAEGTFSGTHTGVLLTPGGEVPPTQRQVTFRWMAMYRIAGDGLASEHLYFDQVELLGQLGLMPG